MTYLRLALAVPLVLVAVAAGCGGSESSEPVATTEVTMVKSYRFEPRTIEIEEYSHYGMVGRYMAGAARLPFFPLRSYAGSHPCEPELTSLVGELSTRSDTFRTMWAAHTVHAHQAGVKRVRHPLVGEITLNYEMLTFAADELPMAVYTTEPSSASEAALNLLASWIATPTTPASPPRPVR